MSRLKYILFLVLVIHFSEGISQELPPIQNFTPTEYRSESQNWAVTQSEDKRIYVANNKGLLEFNGAAWTLYPSPNESIIRSARVIDDRIYTGCYMEFGYWERNDFGTLQYTSLSQKIHDKLKQDEEFWGILQQDKWMLFQSHSRIYIYDLANHSVNIIDSDSFMPKMFQVGQTIYFQKVGEGIFKIENGKAVLAYDAVSVQNEEVINIFQKDRELLILTRNNGFYLTQNVSMVKWPIEADDLLSGISLYSGLRLRNGEFALGTISHGLILMDSNGEVLYHINQVKGLQNNTVLSLFEDLDENIWMGLDVGISYINRSSPFRIYPDRKGLVGSVYASALMDDYLYLGTNQGLYGKKVNDNLDFEFIEGTNGQVWSLNVIDGVLFCGHHTGTYVVKDNQVERISDIQGTWKVGKIESNPNLLIQGNYDGLYMLEKSAGAWGLKNKIGGFNNSARYFEVFGDTIFVNHEYKGVFQVNVDKNYTQAQNIKIDTLIKGSNSAITKYKGGLLYAFKKGIFKYDWSEDKFVKDTVLSKLYDQNEYVSGKMAQDYSKGHLWTFSNSSIGLALEGGLASTPSLRQIPLTEDMRNGIMGYESVSALNDDGKYLFGARSGYLIVDIHDFMENKFQVHIGTIRKAGKNRSETEKSLINLKNTEDFHHTENNLEVSYYVSEYNKYLKPMYRYRLIEIYPKWSEWTTNSSVSFENLPSDKYTLNIQAKIGDKISENVATYEFEIAKPWYASNLLMICYIIGGILGSIAIHTAYRGYYHRKQRNLIESNQREMELAQARNEKEIIKIKNEQLKEDFKSKSNELAASTMSIIKKNELLANVKNQLMSSVEDRDSVKSIINVIDSSLKQNDDWELFKEAFNNADRKFLKKLKKAHPNLSPNDIRLCAYLRLNLSSKEIAPMFNISSRSVEIKRYRLRKKMNLSHDDNLVDYILKL